jgi:hypothetical protein
VGGTDLASRLDRGPTTVGQLEEALAALVHPDVRISEMPSVHEVVEAGDRIAARDLARPARGGRQGADRPHRHLHAGT